METEKPDKKKPGKKKPASALRAEIAVNKNPRWKKRLLISTPTLGIIRFEWAHARFGQIVPMNWESSGFDVMYNHEPYGYDPLGYSIEDAYNLIVKRAMEMDVEWLVTIEDDVVIPPDCYVKIADYINEGDVPIVSGLYYLKASPTQPLVFRGRGNGAFTKFKLGDRVWCDGLPMGCLLIHMSILKWFWNNSPVYKLVDGQTTRKIFETPRKLFFDPQAGGYSYQTGTQDLHFFDRVLDKNVLKKTGWTKYTRRKYPFLCDTSIFCRHIDRNSGRQYP